ncbi:MAG: hypothetical protein HYU47_06500 [Deltaproteobacteria bacterium]|nr:hypothetical protein [Deltaproteobacteria bacterium]
MNIVRIYTGKDQQSHFEEIELSFAEGERMQTTVLQAASSVVFRRVPAGHVIDWHPAPRRQYIVTLSGEWDIECGDGTVLASGRRPAASFYGCAPGGVAGFALGSR